MSRFLSQKFKGKAGYKLGERPGFTNSIKLNANESPYPPSPEVFRCLHETDYEKLKIYADPHNTEFRKSIAKTLDVELDQVFADGGTDVILGYCLLAFGSNKPGFVFPDITYNFYKTFSKAYDTFFHQIPLNTDFTINTEDYCYCNANILIANPNAPTGLILSPADVERIIATNNDHVVIIDEAYIDFGNKSCVQLTKKYSNLIVIQTLSKSRCLAGARLGFAISSPEIISDLETLRASFNPDSITEFSQIMGCAAMKDTGYTKNCTEKIIKTRQETTQSLKDRGFTVTDSHTNFLFTKPYGISAANYYQELKNRRIFIRYYNEPRINEYVRISIGTDEQMSELLKQTDKILKDQKNNSIKCAC